MELPTAPVLATLLGGALRGSPPPVAPRGVAIDSRRVRPGDVFFALPGRHVHGARFAEAALTTGAALSVVPQGVHLEGPHIVVADPLHALQALAAWHRTRAIDRVVAVTGSNGKTVVKDALVALLAARFRVAGSPGSWNSQVGVPLAVLGAPMGTEIGVFEAGVSAPGEMGALEAILRPDCGVFTNVGLAHLASFGSREATASEKLLLFRRLPAGGWVVAPDDPLLAGLPRLAPLQPVARANTATGTRLWFDLDGQRVEVTARTRAAPLLDDLACAIAAAHALGVSPELIRAALTDYSFGPTRMETWRTPDGVTIVNDTASADPISVQAALDAVGASVDARGRRVFLFGGMRELGDRSTVEHALIGRHAAERGFTHLVLLPFPERDATAQGWRAGGGGDLVNVPVGSQERGPPGGEAASRASAERGASGAQGTEAALRSALGFLAAGDTLLVKGPRNEGLAVAAREIWESMSPRRFTVDLGAVRENIARFRAMCGPNVAILAVLKAWAYGTELARTASALQEAGVDWIGVSAADEGAFARRAGVHVPILVMLLDIDEIDKIVRYRLTPVVYSMALARTLADTLAGMGAHCDVHLEVDTGMGRLGVAPDEAVACARFIRASGTLSLTGVMTHLSSADDPAADEITLAQLAAFDRVVHNIRAEHDGPLIIHASATSGAARFPAARHDMVRIGLGLWGIYPSPAIAAALELELAVAFTSRLAQVAVWPRGQRVGYNGSYVITAETQRIGIVEAGYNDGVPWRLSGRGHVVVRGARVAILGRVSMDSMAVDLADVPDAVVGDEVLLFGAHDGAVLRPEVVAAEADTIPYELLVNVDSRRVQRVFLAG